MVDLLDRIVHMLVENTQEAVERYKDSTPAVYMDHVPIVFEHKDSPVPSLKRLHEKDRNKGLDMIEVSVNGRHNRLRSWAGKKNKLVEYSRQLSSVSHLAIIMTDTKRVYLGKSTQR